jgi:hypothetical protein
MINLILIIVSILPIIGEVIFDKHRWMEGKDDKPLSTYLRVATFMVLALLFGYLSEFGFWIGAFTGGLFLFGIHYMFFNTVLNISRPNIKWNYRKEGEFLTQFPWTIEVAVRMWVLYVTWASYFHWDWVLGDYPQTLIEYFKF